MALPPLPPELVAEILSHLRTNPPTSLDGLQIALTCRAMYEEFQPLISAFHVERLARAMTPSTKNLHVSLKVRDHNSLGAGHFVGLDDFKRRAEEAFARASADPSPQKTPSGYSDFEFPDFEVAYLVEPHSLNDVSTLWSLASLLSRPHIALHLRRFTLRWGIKRPIDPTPTAAWQRALARLVQTCTGIEDVELILMGALSPGIPLIGPPPHFEPPALSNSKISKLCIEGIGLTTFWRPHLHGLLTQSATTLTHLSIDSSPHPPDSWEAVFSNEWGLHRLEHFEITRTEVPFTTLARFLLSCPSISSAILSIPQSSQSADGGDHATLIQPEDYPRFLPVLRRLDATPNILLALFDHSPSQNHEKAQLLIPRLENLTVLGEDVISDTHGGESQSYNDLTKLLSCLQGRSLLQTLEMQFRYTSALETWLGSASAAWPSAPREVQAVDGTWSLQGVAESLMITATTSLFPSCQKTPSLQSALASLSHVRSLTLEFSSRIDRSAGYPPNYAIHPHSIAMFMSALPGLEEVVLDGAFYRPENAVKNAEVLWEELGNFWTLCPKLERLEVRKIGGSYTPAVWKRGEEEPTPGFDFNDWAAAFLMVI